MSRRILVAGASGFGEAVWCPILLLLVMNCVQLFGRQRTLGLMVFVSDGEDIPATVLLRCAVVALGSPARLIPVSDGIADGCAIGGQGGLRTAALRLPSGGYQQNSRTAGGSHGEHG